jgi:histidinol phosphatase-like enzyme
MGKYEVARRAVFLDSEGVLNRAFVRNGHPYPPSSVEDLELHDEVAPGFARLKAANFLLVVITNQPDVGRGKQSRETVEAMHLKMQSALPSLWRDVRLCARGGLSSDLHSAPLRREFARGGPTLQSQTSMML